MNQLFFFVLVSLVVSAAQELPPGEDDCQLKADVVFVVDSSRSIWRYDYQLQLDFLANLTRQMNVGPEATHVGALSFSRGARVEFFLNNFTDAGELEGKIRDIPFAQGDVTETYAGLRLAREVLFSGHNGARPDLPHIIIIVTDGNSWNRRATKEQADLTREAGILVFAVGIGDGVDRDQLAELATENTDTYVHTVDTFSDLTALKGHLIPAACEALTTAAPTLPPTSAPSQPPTSPSEEDWEDRMSNDEAQEKCAGKKADVVFVLDKSSSIKSPHFRSQLSWVNEVVSKFKVSKEHTHVSVVTFDYEPKLEFGLLEYFSKSQIQQAVLKIKYTAGSTNTFRALEMVAKEVLTPKAARPSVARVVIVVTDGRSSNEELTKKWARELKVDFGAYLFAVGVGPDADVHELTTIASKPAANHVFMVKEGYHALDKIEELLAIRACEVLSGDIFVRCQQNAVPSNVMFVTHFAHATLAGVNSTAELVRSLAGGIMTSEGKVKVGLSSSACTQISEVALGQAGTAQQFAHAVAVENEGGLADALFRARMQVTADRSVPQKVVVVMVHGPVSDLKMSVRQVMRGLSAGVRFVFVGRERAVEGELVNLASQRPGEEPRVVMEEEEVEKGSLRPDQLLQSVLAKVCEELSPGQPLY